MESAMAGIEPIYVDVGRSFKEARKRIGIVSDLQSFIIHHFNLPHIQVIECSNGAVAIGNLFDGVPDDVQNQDHESFDEVAKLLCWISGSIELPERSHGVAPKVFDEMPPAIFTTEILQIGESLKDDGEHTMANQELDESVICDVLKGDGEEMLKAELKGDSIVAKELLSSTVYQVLEQLPKSTNDDETESIEQRWVIQTESCTLLAPSMGVGVDPGGKFSTVLRIIDVHQVFDGLSEPGNSVWNELEQAILKNLEIGTSFDPGETKLLISQYENNVPAENMNESNASLVLPPNSSAVNSEMVARKMFEDMPREKEPPQIQIRDELNVENEISCLEARQVFGEMLELQQKLKQPKLKVFEVNSLQNATSSLLVKNHVLLNEFSPSVDYLRKMCFDPGGSSLLNVVYSPNRKCVLRDNGDLWCIEKLIEMRYVFGVVTVGLRVNQSIMLTSNYSCVKVNFILAKCSLDEATQSRSLADKENTFKLLNDFTAQGKMMNDHAGIVCFDPGEGYLVRIDKLSSCAKATCNVKLVKSNSQLVVLLGNNESPMICIMEICAVSWVENGVVIDTKNSALSVDLHSGLSAAKGKTRGLWELVQNEALAKIRLPVGFMMKILDTPKKHLQIDTSEPRNQEISAIQHKYKLIATLSVVSTMCAQVVALIEATELERKHKYYNLAPFAHFHPCAGENFLSRKISIRLSSLAKARIVAFTFDPGGGSLSLNCCNSYITAAEFCHSIFGHETELSQEEELPSVREHTYKDRQNSGVAPLLMECAVTDDTLLYFNALAWFLNFRKVTFVWSPIHFGIGISSFNPRDHCFKRRTFDPGGNWSTTSDHVMHLPNGDEFTLAILGERLATGAITAAVILVLVTWKFGLRLIFDPGGGCSRFIKIWKLIESILEDKDHLKRGVLMQDYDIYSGFMLLCILLLEPGSFNYFILSGLSRSGVLGCT